MASIQEYLDLIKNAIYGKDVRQAIHDGIQQCYYDGQAGAIDLSARQRLDTDEANITSLTSRMSTAEGDIDTLDARVDQIVAPSGEAPSAAEVSDARVGADGTTYTSLGDAVRGQVADLNNRLDGKISVTMTDGYYIAPTDGSAVSNGSSSITDWIPVNEGEHYRFSGLYVSGTRAVVAYNIGYMKKETIITGSTDTSVSYTIPSGVAWIRATGKYGKAVEVYKADAFASIEENTKSIAEVEKHIASYKPEVDMVDSIRGIFKADRYYESNYFKYPLPDAAFEELGVSVFTNRRNFITTYKHEEHKNVGGATYYFSPDGRDSLDGLTKHNAKASLANFYTNLNDGDTCILCDGIYGQSFLPTKIQKSINIIAENNGKAIITSSDANYTYTSVEGNTYSTSRSNVIKVNVDLGGGVYTPLSPVDSIANCKATPLSFYSDTSALYINIGGLFVPNNNNVFLCLAQSKPLMLIEPDTSDINIYIEGVVCIGGSYGGVRAQNTANNTFTLHAYECKFVGAYKYSDALYDAISLLGGKAYFEKCVACFSRKDGFNYHANNNEVPLGFELDCEAYGNGIDGTDNTNNGSTAHDGGVVIRINGAYHDNYGSNVADVHDDTKSLNLRCIAFNSLSTETGYSSDFSPQQSGATMWLDCCKAFGSDWSLYTVTGATMYLHDSEYVNTQGGGTINTDWNPYV